MAIGTTMSVDLPDGWQVIRQPVYSDTSPSAGLCLHPAGDTKVVFGCAGLEIDYGTHLPGAHTDPYAPDVADGWYPATDVEQCPFAPAQVNGRINGIETRAGFSKGLRPVGAHSADWNRWSASCASGASFHPQAWFLPKSHVVILDYTGHPETSSVLASAKFAADGNALPAMPTYLAAHLVKENGNTLTVQPFHTYYNDAAGKAYAEAHQLMYPYDDDHIDVDTGARRTVSIGTDTACVGNIVVTRQTDVKVVPCSAFAGHKALTMGIWLQPGTATAESVSELYRP
ncbi:MAG: hypothetical protein JWP74_1340 [Marmoricola sp.]|nr:hypothetical protein [Marmoricola sp.]